MPGHRTPPREAAAKAWPSSTRWPYSDPWDGAQITEQLAREQADLAREMFISVMHEAPNVKVKRNKS